MRTAPDMPIVQVRVNENHLAIVRDALSHVQGGFETAVSRAINRTMDSGRVRISRQIAATTQLKVRQVNLGIRIDKATTKKLNGFVGLSRYRYSLRQFSPRVSPTSGVSVRVYKDRWSFIPQAFRVEPTQAKINRPHHTKGSAGRDWWGWGEILVRRPTSGFDPHWDDGDMGRLEPRFPLMKVMGPSLTDLWEAAPQMVTDVLQYSQQTLEKNIDDQVRLLLRRSRAQ